MICYWGEGLEILDNSFSSLDDSSLAVLSKNGDDRAFDELSLRYLGIINYIASKYSAQGYEQKDFVQEGLLGLLYACRTFDTNSKTKFKTYASLIIERRYVSIIRKQASQKAVPDSVIIQMDDKEFDFEDMSPNPEELVTMQEHLRLVLKRLQSILSKREYDVLMLYASGLSYAQIGAKLSMNEKSVDNALWRARKKILDEDMS